MTAPSAVRGLVSQPIGLSIRPRSSISPLRNPKLGWNTQTQSTAEMAPGAPRAVAPPSGPPAAEEAALQEEGDQRADGHDDRRRHGGQDQRVPKRDAEVVAGDDAPVVPEPDEGSPGNGSITSWSEVQSACTIG